MAVLTKYPTGYTTGNVFTNPQNAYADDGVVATRTSTTRKQNESSYWRDFGFAIPAGSVIQQVDVEGECSISAVVTGAGFGVQLFVGTTAYGTEATVAFAQADVFYIAKQTLTTGLPSVDQLNSSGDTGLRVRVRIYTGNTSTSRTHNLDCVRITVTYTPPVPVAKSLTATYTLRGRVGQSDTAQYALRGLASRTLSPAYSLRSLAGRTLSASYSILQQVVAVGQALSAAYNVRRAVASARETIYSLRALAGAQRAVSYALRGLAGKATSASYAIVSSVASVARDLVVSYALRGRAASSREVAYSVRSLVAAWLDARYDITAAQRVSSALPVAYALRARLASVLVARYRLGRFAEGGVAVDLRAWREQQPVPVASALACVYAVLAGAARVAKPLPGVEPTASPTPVLPTAQRAAAPVVTRSRLEVSYSLAASARREAAPVRDPLAPTIAAIEAVAPRVGRILRLARASGCDG